MSKLISSLSKEKKKLLPEEKEKLKQFLEDSSKESDEIEDLSPVSSDESYKPDYRGYSQKSL